MRTMFFGLVLMMIVMQGVVLAKDLNGDIVLDQNDIQTFFARCSAGPSAYDAALDLDNNGTIDMADALRYGQWINGLYHSPSHPTLYLSNPGDSTAYQNYRTNVAARKNIWNANDLRSRYPDNSTASTLNYGADTVEYLNRLVTMMRDALHVDSTTTSTFTSRLLHDGVAVFGNTSYSNCFEALDAIHSADLPIMVTTDAILETVFRSYENILIQMEVNRCIPMLSQILDTSLAYCNRSYGMADSSADIRDYLTVAAALLEPQRSNYAQSAGATAILTAITTEQMTTVTLFDAPRQIDFSQFKPRGHYTQSVELEGYFKAMMWLSRADVSLKICGDGSTLRQKKNALMLWDCVVNSGAYPQWLVINRIIEFMVGISDGLSVKGMGSLVSDLGGGSIPAQLAHFNVTQFDSIVKSNNYGLQLILSEGIVCNSRQYDSLALSSIFSFMPQRFIPDSYTMSQSVFPFVNYRALPSSLDIAFALGDNSVLNDLADLTNPATSALPGIMGSQRQLYDEISRPGWQSSLYTNWLNMLRQLNGVENNTTVSPVFRTSAWRAKMRNTQLVSWAQLRHATILYAKPSYTGMVLCDYPKAYVEPYPAFFEAVASYAHKGRICFAGIDPQVVYYFTTVEEIANRLHAVAIRTAAGQEPTADQVVWLKTIISSVMVPSGCTQKKIFDGWFFDLLYDVDASWNSDNTRFSNSSIVDVHTKPADDIGPAQVLHAGSGKVHLMATVVELDTCTAVFVGPAGSYYDVITTDKPSPVRLTDDEWETRLQTQHPARPPWAGRFVFDGN